MNITPAANYGAGLDVAKPLDIPSLELAMLEEKQVECPVVHRFSPGIYTREVTIPAGSFAIGHHQNFEHTNIMLKGRVTVLNDDGSTTELTAPMFFVGKPGRKIGYIHEEIVWLNVYATDETNIGKLEEKYLTKSAGWLDSAEAKNKVALLTSDVDKNDYLAVLKEYGFTDETARAQSYNENDMTDLPHGSYKITVSASKIEGRGLFAVAPIAQGEIIAPARINGLRTIAGRYTNHSIAPNAEMIMLPNGDINLVAVKDVAGSFGGGVGDEITINYRQALSLQINKTEALCQE